MHFILLILLQMNNKKISYVSFHQKIYCEHSESRLLLIWKIISFLIFLTIGIEKYFWVTFFNLFLLFVLKIEYTPLMKIILEQILKTQKE